MSAVAILRQLISGFASCRGLELPHSGTKAFVDQARSYILRMSFFDDGDPSSRGGCSIESLPSYQSPELEFLLIYACACATT